MEWKWSKANEKSLAQFISDRTVELLPKLSANPFDLVQSRDGRLKLVQSIYDQLLKQGIQYAYEKYHPEAEIQRIRTPAEVLSTPGEGTCLDLALVFCGLCFGYDLLPLLIVIEGHALAAVSLNHQRRDWNSFARERTLLNSIELFNRDENRITLQKLIEDGAYIAVECTGFAQTQSFSGSMPEAIQRTAQGTLTFDRAIAAGQEQLDNPTRPFQFAIDVAAAHYVWKIEPLSLPNSSDQVSSPSSSSKAPSPPATFNIYGNITNFAGSGGIQHQEAPHQIRNFNQYADVPDQAESVKTILFLAANPKGTSPLRLGEEMRSIQNGLERSQQRDRFALEQRWAVTAKDLRRALLDCQPQIVHFSGHGVGTEGLIFEDATGQTKLVSGEAIANLFSLFSDQVECVVLNACYSEVQAQEIVQHIPSVIGMKRAIGDEAAIEFAVGFYDALLAGRSVEFAYKLGCSGIEMEGIPEHLTPVLKQKEN